MLVSGPKTKRDVELTRKQQRMPPKKEEKMTETKEESSEKRQNDKADVLTKKQDKGQEDEQDFEVIDMEKDLIRPNTKWFVGVTFFPPTTKKKVFIKQTKWEIHKQPTDEEEFESFYIGPIHFNAFGLGFDFTNERNESMAKRINEGLLDILYKHFDPLLAYPSQELIQEVKVHTFSSAVRCSIINGQHSANYCLRHPDSTLSFDENIAFELHCSNFLGRGELRLFFSQYWNGKNPKRLPSLFKMVSTSDAWAHDDIKRFQLTSEAKARHKCALEDWETLYLDRELFRIMDIVREERRRAMENF
jgi:hypothetical protein